MREGNKRNPNIDLVLSVLCCIAEDGETLSFREMGELCGCSPQLLHNESTRAIKKLKRHPMMREIAELYF